jgi:hypothetical protein
MAARTPHRFCLLDPVAGICMGLCVEDQLRLVPWTTYL